MTTDLKQKDTARRYRKRIEIALVVGGKRFWTACPLTNPHEHEGATDHWCTDDRGVWITEQVGHFPTSIFYPWANIAEYKVTTLDGDPILCVAHNLPENECEECSQ